MTLPHHLSQNLILNWLLMWALVPGPFLIIVTRAQHVDQLEPGKLVARELKGGEKHTYPLQLNAND
ncbi:MAG TPA: hypothetical protein PLB32_10340, partial [Acidobacteriota bacterium]|nr:hypothetical protein [Acidobacteriota bacterium]